MDLILNRLETIANMKNANLFQHNTLQHFDQTVAPEKFKHYASHISTLILDYRLILEYLNQHHKKRLIEQDKKRHQIILGALWLNALLISIYRHSGDFNKKSKALFQQRQHLMHAINQNDVLYKIDISARSTLSTTIQYVHHTLNHPRNIIIRSIRAIQQGESAFPTQTCFTRPLHTFNRIANPILAYAAWIFFIPRFLVNLITLCRYLVQISCMDVQEQALARQTKLYLIKKNAITLMNDFVSITSSVLNCFIFIGQLSPIGAYFTLATFIFDAIVAIVHGIHGSQRLKELKNNYSDRPSDDAGYHQAITTMTHYKQRKWLIQIMNTASITILFTLTLPILGLAPIIPFIAQCLLLLVVIGNIIAHKLNAKTNPKTNNVFYSTYGFFSQTNLSQPEQNTRRRKKQIILKSDDTNHYQY